MSSPQASKKDSRGKKPRPKAKARPLTFSTAFNGASREAKRLAAAILEVLSGVRLPSEAAKAISLSVPRYYTLELRALRGLLRACEPRKKGRTKSSASIIRELRQENEKLKRECARYAALVRAAQRTIGLNQPKPEVTNAKGKPRRRRKPTVRALKVAARLTETPPGEGQAAPSAARHTVVDS